MAAADQHPVVATAVPARADKQFASMTVATAVVAGPHDAGVAEVAPVAPPRDPDQMAHVLQERFNFPLGLSRLLVEDVIHNFPLRVWVVDNSGSMQAADGHRLLAPPNGDAQSTRMTNCTRWNELQQVVKFHGTVSVALEARTEFRLLNPPGSGAQQNVFTGYGQQGEQAALDKAMGTSPRGVTPLTKRINEIQARIQRTAPELNANGQQVVVVLATDGLPSDNQGRSTQAASTEFTRALQQLVHGLPVSIIVRLMTDEDQVVDYWNNLDGQVETSMDVLDDFEGEAREVQAVNPWLTYGLPLHQAREFGVKHRLLDLIDERAFTPSEIREFLTVLLGWDDIPEPELDWALFERHVQLHLESVPPVFDPLRKRPGPWIDLRKLRQHAGKSSCLVS